MELETETFCRDCGGPVAHRFTGSSYRMLALDIEPTESGMVDVLDYQDAQVLTHPQLGAARSSGAPLYDPHVCPDVWSGGRG